MESSQLALAWSSNNALNYYLNHRNKANELYKSEKYFIEGVLKNGRSLLDIGCAAGGFSEIVRGYNKDIEYTGVDISQAMVEKAKKRFPGDKFYLTDGKSLDFPDRSFDICLSLGVLHMTEGWKELLAESWRVCKNTFLFDLRLVEKEGICDPELSYQRIEFEEKWDGATKVPYVVVGLDEIICYLTDLKPNMRSLKAYGYWHPVSNMVVSKYDTVCMAVFCLEKEGGPGISDWQLPLELSGKLRHKLKI